MASFFFNSRLRGLIVTATGCHRSRVDFLRKKEPTLANTETHFNSLITYTPRPPKKTCFKNNSECPFEES